MLQARHILVADPTPHMAGLIATMLRSIGAQAIATVNEGPALLLALKRTPFTALVLNDRLGSVDAVDLVRQIRAGEPEDACLPIVMLFSEASKSRIEEARDAGVTEFLRKPLSATVLEARLAQAIQHPRPAIHADSYTGPDRRRRAAAAPTRRRRSDGPTAA
ncbi:MAG TPA: response regulator [Devosia sp.]|nr:response regulator [Devosia sp.]